MPNFTMSQPVKILGILTTLLVLLLQYTSAATTHYLDWGVGTTNFTRNCHPVNVGTVNGQLPGPTVEIYEGDTVIINVTNRVEYDVTIHWHGIFQFLTNWADGVAHITQCPLKAGSSQIYEFTLTGQSGTFFWHAHTNWLRASVYGAFIVHPAVNPPYGEVAGEHSLLFGEWFNQDPNVYELNFINTLNPIENATVAYTINGNTGPLYGCPEATDIFEVREGSTYLLRLTNAGLNNNVFFKVANHSLTVVAADGNYLKPFTTDVVVVAPGQTTDVLLTANQTLGSYYCGISTALASNVGTGPPATAALAIINYVGSNSTDSPVVPEFPSMLDPTPVDAYHASLKGYNNYHIPQAVDHDLIYVTGIASVDCIANENCTRKVAGTVQNSTFDDPKTTSLLEAYYNNVSGVYTTDIPDKPPVNSGDYTSLPGNPAYRNGTRGTKVRVVKHNDTVQLVLQNMMALGMVDHPFHLHGHDFYVIGKNYSNYDPLVDPSSFNLVDPPLFNTFTLPSGGWVAIRFQANNPGVWLLHCHYDRHKTWGMQMAFIVENGANTTLPGPVHPPPPCS